METRQKRKTATSGQRSRSSGRTATKRRPGTSSPRPRTAKRSVAPEVVYTPAKPFNRNRLLLQLGTVVAVALALSFGMSIFFKVGKITVSGTEKYSAWMVKEASGIEIGDNLLSFGEPKAAGKIQAALPYVEKVRVGIRLPDTVNIEIVEMDVAYSVQDSTNQWWLITAEGRVVDNVDSATAGDYTKVLGVQLAAPVVGQQAVAQELPPSSTEETGVTMPVTVRASDKLNAALSILQYMEKWSIIGEAASVNVEDFGSIELWYGQQYQVKLGDATQLSYKIECMNAAIKGDNGLKEYDSGILDISFTLKENQVIYEPFE